MKESKNQEHSDKLLREALMDVLKKHGASNDKMILTSIGIKWTQIGYDLAINGYSFEYRDKSEFYTRTK